MTRPTVFLLLLLVLLPLLAESAKFCFSGQNNRYVKKQCSTGGDDLDYTCQKFVCEGGKAPFTLRTCARKNQGCIAGPRVCKFSGGQGSCAKCESDGCNN
uniref:Chitin-binding type-2 domain-containing protein n=1 Tax=Steinernema glaseri TaxID=37863 RepID=A0A1I7ZZD1_9BILA